MNIPQIFHRPRFCPTVCFEIERRIYPASSHSGSKYTRRTKRTKKHNTFRFSSGILDKECHRARHVNKNATDSFFSSLFRHPRLTPIFTARGSVARSRNRYRYAYHGALYRRTAIASLTWPAPAILPNTGRSEDTFPR